MPTTAEVAERLGVTPQRVRWLCRNGRLVGAYRRGRDWWVPTASLDAYTAARRPRKDS